MSGYADDISLSINGSTSVSESASVINITAVLTRDSNSDQAVELNYQTEFTIQSPQAAEANSDYQAANGTEVWQTGESGSRTISFTIVDDVLLEETEVFDIVFSTNANVTIDGSATSRRFSINIIDNDVVGSTAKIDTPQAAIAETLNFFCANLKENDAGQSEQTDQQALLDLCGAFETEVTAAATAQALRAISPAAAASQVRISQQMLSQQVSNIGSRLSAVRSGINTASLSGLSFSLNGEAIPADVTRALSAILLDEESSALSSLLGKRYDIFVSGNYSFGERKDTANETGYKPHQFGISTGIDYKISSRLVTGLALGLSQSTATLNGNSGEVESKGYDLLFYSTYFHKNDFYIDGLISIGKYNFDLTRNVNFILSGVQVAETELSDTQSLQTAMAFSGGYDHSFGNGSSLGFNGQFNFAKSNIDGYQERNASGNTTAYDLSINEQSSTSISTNLGLSLSHVFSMSKAVVIPQFKLSWIHEFSNNEQTVSGYFVADKTNTNFGFKSSKPDRNYVTAQVAVSTVLTGGLSIFTSYQSLLAYENLTNHQISIGLRKESPF